MDLGNEHLDRGHRWVLCIWPDLKRGGDEGLNCLGNH